MFTEPSINAFNASISIFILSSASAPASTVPPSSTTTTSRSAWPRRPWLRRRRRGTSPSGRRSSRPQSSTTQRGEKKCCVLLFLFHFISLDVYFYFYLTFLMDEDCFLPATIKNTSCSSIRGSLTPSTSTQDRCDDRTINCPYQTIQRSYNFNYTRS